MRSRTSSARRLTVSVSVAALAVLLLAACGSSSSKTTAAAGASSTAKTATAPPAGNSSRFTALRACLQKQGITLPQPKTGAPPRGSGGNGGGFGLGGGGGAPLPKGVTRSQFQAALKTCGAANFGGRVPGQGFNRAGLRTALAKYASCLRENGINVPAPNTSGNGPVFNTKGIDTTSPAFVKAQQKCSADLPGTFRGSPGTRRPPGAGGEPQGAPAPGAAPPS
jgi:hypothetical protein